MAVSYTNTTVWYDSVDQIYYPIDYVKWEDLGAGFNNTTTITSVNGASVSNGALTFGQSHTSYWQLTYNDSLRLHNRTSWTIEFRIRINTDSTSTTNFQTSNDGIIMCQGAGDIDAAGVENRPNWVVYLDSNNQLNFGYYHTTGWVSTTSADWKLGNDDYYDVTIKKSGLLVSVFINNVAKGLITLNSADIASSTDDLYIGGNPGGDYLYNADIDAIRIRKDRFLGDTLTASGDVHLIDNTLTSTATYDGKWDTDVILYLPVTESSGTTTAQAYLKTFPATWGDWTEWFQNPKAYTEFTLTTQSEKDGFKDVTVTTTDGFMCSYGAGATVATNIGSTSTQWRLSYGEGIHQQGGDIDFMNAASPTAPKRVNFNYTAGDTASVRLRIPTRGYHPAGETVGKRPRGIKKILFTINNKFVEETVSISSDNGMHTLGMPYYDYTFSGKTYEGGFYNSGNIANDYRDWDFRFSNATVHITSFTKDSADALVANTYTAHGLSTGDTLFVRPGVPYNSSLANHSEHTHDIWHRLHGVKYVQVIDSTSFKIFYDLARTNEVTFTGTVPSLYTATGQTVGTWVNNYIGELYFRLFEWSQSFESLRDTERDTELLYGTDRNYIKNANLYFNQDPMFPDYYQSPNLITVTQMNLPGERNKYIGNKFASLDSVDNYNFKPIPLGTQSDPFIIKSVSGGYTTGSAGDKAAPIYLDVDMRHAGTLKIAVSDVETADSTTPTTIGFTKIINGEGSASGPPSEQTASYGSTISITCGKGTRSPIPADNRSNYYVSASVVVYLKDVVHSATGDRSRATYTIWYEPDNELEDTNYRHLLYAGGLQPGREIGEHYDIPGPNATGRLVQRPGNWVTFKGIAWDGNQYDFINPTIDFKVQGIPPIAYTPTGETFLSNGLDYGSNQVLAQLSPLVDSGHPQHYDLPQVSTTSGGGGIGFTGPAPWIEQATMTQGEKRFYRGFFYTCETTHISSKNFDDDYNLGYWTQRTETER